MAQHLLLTRPSDDYTTRYLSAWAEDYMTLARTKGFEIIDLQKQRANRNEFISVILKRDPILVVINGHGNKAQITGTDNEILIQAGQSSGILIGRITYAISCSSAKILGADVGKNPNTSYIGYQEDFIFMYSNEHRTRPRRDKIAEKFLSPANSVVTTLLKGHSTGDAVARAKQEYLQSIQKLLSSKTSADDASVIRYLVWDMRNLALAGDANKKIY